MKIVLIILLGLFFLGLLVLAVTSVILSALRLSIWWNIKKCAQREYELLTSCHEALSVCRRQFYKAKFIEDELERKSIQDSCTALYKRCLEILEDPENREYLEHLSKEKQEELEEILSFPRHELI